MERVARQFVGHHGDLIGGQDRDLLLRKRLANDRSFLA
jgi:hypothetical protein